MSLWLNLGQLATRAGGLLPTIDHLISWLTRPTADGKTLANSKGVDADLTAVNCLQFDGSNDYVDTGIPLTENISFEATLKPNYTTNGKRCGTAIDTNNRMYFEFLSTNKINAVIGTGSQLIQIPASEAPEGVFGTIRLYPNGDVYWNGVNKGNTGGDVTGTGTINIFAGAMNSGGVDINNQDTEYSDFKVYENGQLIQHLPLAEGSGTKVYDVSGNGNHGTISDATWSTLDGIESWNHEYGFDAGAVLDGSDDYVDTGVSDQLVKKYSVTFTPTVISDGVLLGLRIFRPACLELLSDGSIRTGLSEGEPEARGNSLGANRTAATTIVAGTKYTVEVDYDNNEIKINDVVQSTFATSGRNHRNDNVWIGGRFDLGALQHPFNGIIHNVKLESATAVIRDFVPSEDGLYDKVNSVYYSNDGTGTITTKRIPALNTKTKQVATFDGVDDNVLSNTTGLGVGDFYYGLKFKYKFKSAKYLFLDGNTASSQGGAWSALQYGGSTGGLVFKTDDDTTKVEEQIIANGTIPDNSIIEGYVQRVGGTISFNLTNLTNSAVYSGSYSNTTNFFHSNANRKLVLGGAYTSSAVGTEATVEWFDFKAGTTSTNLVRHYDFQSDIGTTTVQDLSTSNIDGTVTVGSGGLATFWGQRVADASGSLVSADYATGNTSISNPAGFVHNNSECGVKLQSRTVGTREYSATNLFSHTNGTNNTWVKELGSNITQIGQYDEDETLTSNEDTQNDRYFG